MRPNISHSDLSKARLATTTTTTTTNSLTSTAVTTTATTVSTTLAASAATVKSAPATPPRLKISAAVYDASTPPTSPKPMLSPRAIPQSPRSFSSKNSSHTIQPEKINADVKSVLALPTPAPKSQGEKNEDSPPPYALIDTLDQPSSPAKLTINLPAAEKNENDKQEVQQFSEPVLTPRRNRIARHTAILRRNTTELSGKVNASPPTSPLTTPRYTREKIISSLSAEITQSAIDGKTASLGNIRTLGRVDTVFKIDELPEELRSVCKTPNDKKISSTTILRQLFSDEYKTSSNWASAKVFIDFVKLKSDPSVKMGETDEKIKEAKLAILQPLAKNIAGCLVGSNGLLAAMGLPNEFFKNFLFHADEKILEWGLNSDALNIKDINAARCVFFYNLVALRFINPIITAEFGDKPSQMDIWMQSLITEEFKKNIYNNFKDFLAESGKELPEKLTSRLNDKASIELRNKRIAEFQNNFVSKPKKNKFSKNKIDENKEKTRLKIKEQIKEANLGLVDEIKKQCGISQIKGKFSEYIESDIGEWLSLDTKVDKPTIILNLNFSVYNYLANNSGDGAADENIAAIKKVSEALEQLKKANIPEDVKRHTTFIGDDLKSILYQNIANSDSKRNSMEDGGADAGVIGSQVFVAAPSITSTTTTTATTMPTTATTTTTTTRTVTTTADVTSFTTDNTERIADAEIKENKSLNKS